MKVLVVLDNDLVNDGRVLKELAIFDKFKIRYKVLCFDQDGDYQKSEKIVRISNGNFIKTKLQPIVNTLPFASKIWIKEITSLLKEFDADAIHVHDLYMMPPVWSAVKNMNRRPKLVLDLHENYPYAILNYEYATQGLKRFLVRPAIWKKKEESILSKADSIIVLDKNYGHSLVKKYPTLKNKEIVEFPNYPDYRRLDQTEKFDFKIPNKHPVMLYFGGIAKSRGIVDAIRAFKKVITTGKKLNFLLIGPINKAFVDVFESHISDVQIKDYVYYIPWIKLSQLKVVMSKCSFAIAPFHVNPQIESGVANKIFQYLYGSLPVIVSNAKPMANLIKENNCGQVFTTIIELENCILKYLESRTLVTEHGKNGKEAVLSSYQPSKFEERLINLYEVT